MAFGLGIGVTMALLVAAGVAAGRWADARLGTDPALTVVGLLLGLGAGVYAMIRQVAGISAEERRKGDGSGAGPDG